MTKRELLQEQYEDALFALLMDELAVSEGISALEENERLFNNTNSEVPLDVQKRCLKKISACFNKQHMHKAKRITFRVINKVAIIVLLGVVLFTTAFAASPTFRINALNLAIEVFDDRTEFSFVSEENELQSLENTSIIVNWLPDGYTLESCNGGSKNLWNVYKTINGGQLEITVYLGPNSVVGFDTEDAYVEDIVVQGFDAMYVEKETVKQIIWADTVQGLVWEVYGIDLSKENLFQIAENLILK